MLDDVVILRIWMGRKGQYGVHIYSLVLREGVKLARCKVGSLGNYARLVTSKLYQ